MRMIIPIGMLIVMTHLQLVILHVIHLEGFCLFFSIIHYSLSSLCFPPWFSVCQSWHVIVWLAHLFHAFWVFCYMCKVCQIAIDRYWTIIYICIHVCVQRFLFTTKSYIHTCTCTNMCMSMYICIHMYEFFEKYLKGLKALKCHVSKVSLCIGSFPIFVTYWFL